jgi:hypothetical protein
LKKTNPHKMPSKLFEFHKGNAILNPTSRIAKIVKVFATAQMHPAKTAQIIKWGVRRISARTEDVPKIKAGTLHRARKTPKTIINEITTGEIPTETNLVGASAAPSQAPAVNPESTPTTCNFRAREATAASVPTSICELKTVSISSHHHRRNSVVAAAFRSGRLSFFLSSRPTVSKSIRPTESPPTKPTRQPTPPPAPRTAHPSKRKSTTRAHFPSSISSIRNRRSGGYHLSPNNTHQARRHHHQMRCAART